ncbi:MAG: hypothetical protein WBE58_20535 [Verrucomicrobiales bacterium]
MSFTVERAFDLLMQSREQGRFAHAYLITGDEGSGKRELSARLIRAVNALPENLATLDDLASGSVTVVRPEMKSRRIGIGAIRETERIVHLAVGAQTTKFVVVVEADRMGEQAENAFLKTLEEPPRGTVLLLLTANPEALLPTILSRCIRIPLQGLGSQRLPEASLTFLKAVGRHFAAKSTGLAGVFGLMGTYSDTLKEGKKHIETRHGDQLKIEKEHYARTTEGDWLKRREEYFQARVESDYLQLRQHLSDDLMTWFGDVLRQQKGVDRLDLPECAEATRTTSQLLTSEQVLEKIDAIETLRSHYQTNVNESLATEVAFIKIFG